MSDTEIATDTNFEERTLSKVERIGDRFQVDMSDGWSFQFKNRPNLQPPMAGETIRLYGRGLGYSIRGVSIGKRVFSYETEVNHREYAKARQARRDRSARKACIAHRAKNQARIDALPDSLMDRVNGFMEHNEGWFAKFGKYELMVCEQTAALATHMGTSDRLQAFAALPYKEQGAAFPEMDPGHSGNSFGQVLRLTGHLLDRPELVPKEHGALCPLAGCEAYGCVAARDGKGQQAD